MSFSLCFQPRLALFIAVLCAASNLQAQGVYGFRQNVVPPDEGLLLSRFDVASGTWTEDDTLAFAEGFALGTSTFDNVAGQYVFVGAPVGGGPLSWYNFDVEGDVLSAEAELVGSVHSVHHDMQQDRFFGLQGYPTDSVWVDLGVMDGDTLGDWQTEGWGTRWVDIQPFTAEVTPLLDLPEVEAVIAGASCVDSDLGHYHFLSLNPDGVTRLVRLDASNVAVDLEVDLVLDSEEAFAEIEFCIPTGQVIGLWRDLSGDGPMRLAALDLVTGEPNLICELPQVWAFAPDGSVFDQATESYVLHYYDVNLQPHLLAVDVVTGETWADWSLGDSSFLELECSNRNFAAARYGLSSVGSDPHSTLPLGVQWREGRLVFLGEGEAKWRWLDAAGRHMDAGVLQSGEEVPVHAGHGWLLWESAGAAGGFQLHRLH